MTRRVTNLPEIVFAFERAGREMEAAVLDALQTQAQKIAARMKEEAPKFQTTLTNSIHVESPTPHERLIGPGVDYAEAVHDGVKPGKGLPRFFDPAAVNIVRWLQSKAGTGRPARLGSFRRVVQELALRDRYFGLSWHVRHHGTKGNPFVARTQEAMADSVMLALKAAAARGLQAGGGDVSA